VNSAIMMRLRNEPVFRALVLITVAWFYVFSYSQKLNNPNERTRVLQARALASGQFHIGHTEKMGKEVIDLYGDRFAGPFVNDVALVCHDETKSPPDCDGLIYPAKAPGTALLGLPAIAVAQGLGLVPDGRGSEALATWILRVFGVTIPMLLCLLAWISILRRFSLSEELIARVLLATGLGTGVYTYSGMFVGHALAGGVLVAGIWALLKAQDEGTSKHRWAVFGGLFTGASVLFEYHAVVAVLCVGSWVVFDRKNWRAIPGFALGGLVALGIHSFVHIKCFGSPLQTGHFYLLTEHNRTYQSSGFLGITGFHSGSLKAHLFDPYMGFLFIMPWIIFGWLAGGWAVLKSRGDVEGRSLRWLLFAIPLVYLLFVSLLYPWDVMNGWSVGPRYLVPATLPLTLLIALGWSYAEERWWWTGRVLSGLAAASVVMIASVTVIFPSLSDKLSNPFADVAWPMLNEGFGAPNLGARLGLGSYALAPYFFMIGLVVFLIVRDLLPEKTEGIKKQIRLQSAFLLAVAWLVFMVQWSATPVEVQQSAQLWVAKNSEGTAPTPDCYSLDTWCSFRCVSSKHISAPVRSRRRPANVKALQAQCGFECPTCD
jgi:hypothetical protein